MLGALQLICGILILALQLYFILIQDFEGITDMAELVITAFVGLIFILMGANNIREA